MESFQFDDNTGSSVSDETFKNQFYDNIVILQRIAYKYYHEELNDLALGSIVSISNPKGLKESFNSISDDKLIDFCYRLRIIPNLKEGENDICNYSYNREILLDILADKYCKRKSQIEEINSIPILASEELIWDDNLLPIGKNTNRILALPKLNLQFLTFQDYLLRNFILFRLESYYDIRQDLVEQIKRMDPRYMSSSRVTEFRGFSRYSLPITSFKLLEVKKPKLGQIAPSRVTGELVLDYSTLGGSVKKEWENLKVLY